MAAPNRSRCLAVVLVMMGVVVYLTFDGSGGGAGAGKRDVAAVEAATPRPTPMDTVSVAVRASTTPATTPPEPRRPPPSGPRVGICVAGGVRSLPLAAPSLQTYLIDALGGNTHVFLETSTKHDCLANVFNVQMLTQCMQLFEEVKAWVADRANLERAFPTSNITVNIENDFTCAHPFVKQHVCCARDQGLAMNDNGFGFIWGMTQYMRRRLCYDRLKQHEVTVGRKFDLVVITRPDMLFLEPVPSAEWLLTIQPRVYAMSKDDGWGDYLYIAPRALADDVDRVFDESFTIPCRQPEFHRYTPPEARMGPLMSDGVPHLRWPFQAVIMRSNVRADCTRLRNGLNDKGLYRSPTGDLEPLWQQCMRSLPEST